jgi:CheY-like chemotaxis protein
MAVQRKDVRVSTLPGAGRVPTTTTPPHREGGAASGVQVRHQPASSSSGQLRLLLVCPQPASYAAELERGYQLEVVDSGAAAIELLLWDNDFRLILCAAGLSDFSGSELLRKLHSIRGLRCPPVVIFGGDDPNEVIRSMQIGVRQYITGPCPPAELLNKVDRLTQFARLARLAR